MIEPLRLSLDLRCSAEHAFRVWTERTERWWPLTHTATSAPGLKVVIEPIVGGRIFERTPAGAEVDWGEITVWDPPARLGYLWWIATDRERATEVDIRFVALGKRAARVVIEHRGWERLGERGQSWRDRNLGGWNGILPSFTATAEAE